MINGELIKRERVKRGMSQEELGNTINVSKVSICGYEKGTKTPTLENFVGLAKVLNLQPNQLLGQDNMTVHEEMTPYGFTDDDKKLVTALHKNMKLYRTLLDNIERLNKVKLEIEIK